MEWQINYALRKIEEILLQDKKYFTSEELLLRYKDKKGVKWAKEQFVYKNCYYIEYGDIDINEKPEGKWNKNKQFYYLNEDSDIYKMKIALERDRKIN